MRLRPSHRSILFAASFLLSLACGVVNFALIFYVRERFGADKATVGLVSSAQTLGYFAGILGFLAWRGPHPRYALWLSAWSMAACVAVFRLAPSWPVVALGNSLFGLAMALFWPRIMGWLSWGLEGAALGATMGRFNFSWASGGMLGPYLGGLLVEADARWPFWAAAGLLAATGALMPLGGRLFPALKAGPAPRPAPQAPDAPAPAAAVAPNAAGAAAAAGPAPAGPTPLRFPARLAGVNAYLLTGALLFIFPAFAKDSLGFAEPLIGAFLLVRMFAATAGFELWGRWTFWHFRFWPLAAATAALVVLTLAFPSGAAPWQFFVLFALAGLVFSFLYSYALFHGVAGSVRRERSMTIHEACLNVGLFAGTLGGGWVSERWSMPVVFAAAAGLAAVLLAVQSGLRLKLGR
jgi:MFS family permease